MRLSHSKLDLLLSCPMSYYLSYELGIQPKVEKTALQIGSAVHWGIEHNTEDLSQYFKENGSFGQAKGYSNEQILAEAMVHGYLKHKDTLFDEILKDDETGERLQLLEEQHEFYITGILPSIKHPEQPHDFVGIIDLRLKTNKGYIIIDYKTSTFEPEWEKYLDQIYRYYFMSETREPDIPVYKCGIINIRKTGIRQKKDEAEVAFINRIKKEYDITADCLVKLHMYTKDEITRKHIDEYVENLSKMADTAQMIVDNKAFFINYGAANGQYGKSPYWNIFYHVENSYNLYHISDFLFDEESGTFIYDRDCNKTDMRVIDTFNIINKFDKFKKCRDELDMLDDENFLLELISSGCLFDEDLIIQYFVTYNELKKVPVISDIILD